MRVLLAAVIAFIASAAACVGPPALAPSDDGSTEPELPGTAVRTLFDEDRFLLETASDNGEVMRIFTDTGGGLFISSNAVARLGLATDEIDVDGQPRACALVPDLAPGGELPQFVPFEGYLPIIDANDVPDPDDAEAMLGQGWFRDRVWMFDYVGGELRLLDAADAPPSDDAHTVSLGFPTSASGDRQTNYPRIQATIDGEVIDLLFDTGATARMSSAAHQALDDGRAATRATSFIIQTTFDRWRERHPDWRVLENADSLGEPMIEVPSIDVAGFTVGPVWFTRRADSNFHEFMSQFMDQRIDGALGGSALSYFRVTVDYPNARALFQRRD